MDYPVNLRLAGWPCTVVGGGRVAERKARRLLASKAAVTVIAPTLTPMLTGWATAGEIRWREQAYAPGCLAGARLVFAATDAADINAAVSREARAQGALVNDAVTPGNSDFTVPASMARGDLLLTVSTGGGSPELARQVRQELEQFYPETFADWLERLTALRQALPQVLGTSEARQAFWRAAMDGRILGMVRAGQLDRAEEEVRHAIIGFGTQS